MKFRDPKTGRVYGDIEDAKRTFLWEVKPRKYPDGVFRLCWYEPIAEVDPRLFPSVKPGGCIELEDPE